MRGRKEETVTRWMLIHLLLYKARVEYYELQSFEKRVKMKTRLYGEVLLLASSSRGLRHPRTPRLGKQVNKQLYACKHTSLRITNKSRKPS